MKSPWRFSEVIWHGPWQPAVGGLGWTRWWCLQSQPVCDSLKIAHYARGVSEIRIWDVGFAPANLKKNPSFEADAGSSGAPAERTFWGELFSVFFWFCTPHLFDGCLEMMHMPSGKHSQLSLWPCIHQLVLMLCNRWGGFHSLSILWDLFLTF